MSHIGHGLDTPRGSEQIGIGDRRRVLRWNPRGDDARCYDLQCRMVLSQVCGSTGSAGVQFEIFRVLGATPVPVAAIVLVDNQAELVIPGPYDQITVEVLQLGNVDVAPPPDTVTVEAVARLES